MRLLPEKSPLPRVLVFPLLTMVLFAALWLHYHPVLVLYLAHCPLKDATGIPCPTCGGTHAATALARGDLGAAFTANPLVPLVALGFFLWAVYAVAATIVTAWRRSLGLSPAEKKAARILAALLIGFAWFWQFFR